MSSWTDFKADAGKFASKAAVKAGELTDAATSHLKLQGLKLRLCEEYEKLGKIKYVEIKTGNASEKESEIVANIDTLRRRIKKLEAEIEARRAAREEAKEASEGDGEDEVTE